MRFLLILIISQIFLTGCRGVTIDADEEYMGVVCKCEAFRDGGDFKKNNGQVRACARKINDTLKWGFVIDDKNCETILPFIYEGAGSFKYGLAPVKKGDLWGVIDTNGILRIRYSYQNLFNFSDSLALFANSRNNKGFISLKGDTVIKPIYKYASPFFAQISFVQNTNDKWSVLNLKGQILPIKMDSLIVHENQTNDYENFGLNIYKGKLNSNYAEFTEYKFYSNGEKVNFLAFDGKYAILHDSVDTRLIIIGERKIPNEKLKPIFKTQIK